MRVCRRQLIGRAALCLVAAVCAAPAAAQGLPSFRGSITLVPVDVRVLDRSGRPITNLTRDDFLIFEDDVPQTVDQFLRSDLAADERGRARPGPVPDPALAPPERRVFLIVLGRGRQTGPVGVLPALRRLLDEHLLPEDQVAIAAYNRATTFTVNRALLAGVVARYERLHLEIEARLNQALGGLASAYRTSAMPASIQSLIDEIFDGQGAELPAGDASVPPADAARIAADTRRTAEAIERAATLRERGGPPGLPDSTGAAEAELADASFDEYVERTRASMGDLSTIYKSITYLRRVAGEKHVLFVTPAGLFLPRAEDEDSLAAAASDARVVLDVIHTGGVVAAPLADSRGTVSVPTGAQVFNQTFRIQGLRAFTSLTGGQLWAFQRGADAVARLDRSTRFQYLLGYVPARPALDGTFRRIRVALRNRPGATVLARMGYYARETVPDAGGREFLTYTRIISAGGFTENLQELAVQVSARVAPDGAGVDVEVTVGLDPVELATEGGRRTGRLDVSVFVGDERQDLVGESWQKVELRLTEETFRVMLREGFTHTVRIPVSGSARYVKAVVYDFASDRVGSRVLEITR